MNSKMKFYMCVFAMLAIGIGSTQAQKVKLKKGVVYVDDAECLKQEGKLVPGYTFSSLAGDELFYVGSANDGRNPYWRLTFLKEKKSISYRATFPTNKALITKLVSEGVLVDCATINYDKVDTFIAKYDERIDK